MTITDKVEKHGKPRGRRGKITLKVTSGLINQGLRRKCGTRVNIHSKNGARRRLLRLL
jgi:hypothetical protein